MPESIHYQPPTQQSSPATALVELQSVHKTFDQQPALSDVHFVLQENETTAIVGGWRKSTLLQLVNGLLLPSCGTVKVFGKPLPYDALPAVRRRIGYAVQQVGLFPHLSVFKNVTLLAQLDGWQRATVFLVHGIW